MNLFNKYEAVGIFLSIAVMALALTAVRFKADILVTQLDENPGTQSAIVAVSDDVVKDANELEKALKESFSLDGELLNLVVDDVRIGTGASVKDGDKVTVHYVGTLQDGTRFDSSYDRGEPFFFTVGKGSVIQGWEKGLVGMKVGGQRILVIPGDMAYGNRQVGVIPANATLVFAIELLKIE